VGGSISDYFEKPNVGVIEFLLIHPAHRGQGLARRLLEHTESLFQADALHAGWQRLDYIMGEMNDPFRTPVEQDNVDPWQRALIWGGWGYGVLDFPYTQPPLDEEKSAVGNLLLMCKDLRPCLSGRVPTSTVKVAVHEYLRLAMRFDDPETSRDYQHMAAFLDARKDVCLLPLRSYVGRSESAPLDIQPVSCEDEFALAVSAYERAFPVGQPTVVDATEFWKLLQLQQERGPQATWRYHLWCLRPKPEVPVSGMASFFAYPWGGFGGYATMHGALQNPSRRTQLRIRMEEQMLRDYSSGTLWYAECDPEERENLLFARNGFHEIAVDYRQLPLQHMLLQAPEPQGASRLRLYCRVFGRSYAPPVQSWRCFLGHMRDIFESVYWQADGSDCSAWRHLEAQAPADMEAPIPLLARH